MSEPKGISTIPGNTRILLIAPHGKKTDPKDDINTDKITRKAVEMLKCSGIVNDTVGKHVWNYNSIFQVNVARDGKYFIKAIKDVVEVAGLTLVVWIHGIDDKNIDEEAEVSGFKEDLHAIIGYGQASNPIDKKDTESRFTAKKELAERFRDLLTKNGMTTILTRPDAKDYRGRDPDNMNQWFLKEKYKLDQVQSIQLEIRKTGFRDKKDIKRTAKIISSALNKLIPPAQKIADKPTAEYKTITEVLNATETSPFDGYGKDVKAGKETQKGKAAVHDDNLPGVIGETDTDDALVEKAYKWLESCFKQHVADFMLEAGQYIIKEFYGNNFDYARQKRKVEGKSLLKLIQRINEAPGDVPSRAWIYNAVNYAVFQHDYGKISTGRNLKYGHILALTRAPENEKKLLIEETYKRKYTVGQLKKRVSEIKKQGKPGISLDDLPATHLLLKEDPGRLRELEQLAKSLIVFHQKQADNYKKTQQKLTSVVKDIENSNSTAIDGKKGFREWSAISINICRGCSNDCLYCFNRAPAYRRKQVRAGHWKDEIIIQDKIDANRKLELGVVAFPTTHDITPKNIDGYLVVLGKLLKAGNEVLIVSKPRFECIKQVCDASLFYRDEILFRFTIGAQNNDLLNFWEPNAPAYEERKICLEHAFNEGFKTSVSMEPLLDADNVFEIVKDLMPYVNETIWIGKMQHLGELRELFKGRRDVSEAINEIEAKQSDENIWKIYDHFKDNPQIMWKDSIKKVIGNKEPIVEEMRK